jgi:nucleoid-associated protein YgaU
MGLLFLQDGETRWSVPWSQAGMHLDVESTVQAAFAIGHTGNNSLREHIQIWLQRQDVAPLFSVERAQARRWLEELAPALALDPTNATVKLPENGQGAVVAVPGIPGRQLNVAASLEALLAAASGNSPDPTVALAFSPVPPDVTDAGTAVEQIERMLDRKIALSTYDVLTDETFSWVVERGEILSWLNLVSLPDGPDVTLDHAAVEATLNKIADGLGNGRGFRLEEATQQVTTAFQNGGGAIRLYMTHPQRTYTVQPGDSLSSIAAKYGMTSWHIADANPSIDPDWLNVGQELTIPSQDELTPYLPVPGKRIVVSIAEQRLYAYESERLVFEWPISTGVKDSPTHSGVFQVLDKDEYAYASRWDLWMPHFLAIYAAGPNFYNGFHGLPTLSSGGRLWEGLLGSPASYGCIILGLEEGETLYDWADVGVVAVIE